MDSIRVLQVNLNRNAQATEAVLELAKELNISLILVQEPWLISPLDPKERRSINHPSFGQILPVTPTDYRPRTIVYYSRNLRKTQINYREDLYPSPDIMVLDIIQEKGQFRLYNIYNQRDQKDKRSPYTIERVLAYSKLNSNSLLAGDLNCHHP